MLFARQILTLAWGVRVFLKASRKLGNDDATWNAGAGFARVNGRHTPAVSMNRALQTFTVNNSHFDFFSLISNSPTYFSYQNRSSFSVGCFWLLLVVVPFFSHNFNNTSVIIPPMITALNIAPFKNSSEGNILLVCPEQAQITPHTVKGICS